MNEERQLVTRHGMLFLSDGGPVEVQLGDQLSVTDDGRLTASQSGEFGRLLISTAPDISRAGRNLFTANGPTQVIENPKVQQGQSKNPIRIRSQPWSNSSKLRAILKPIKAMQASDEADGKLLRRRRLIMRFRYTPQLQEWLLNKRDSTTSRTTGKRQYHCV